MQCLPVSAVVPTRNRPRALHSALASLEEQQLHPAELIVVDASDDDATRSLIEAFRQRVGARCAVRWEKAKERGAAVQRNQGLRSATQPFVWFFDDDILFQPECVARLWRALETDAGLGGVNAMTVNQRYETPGRLSRLLFTLLHGSNEPSFAGRVIGPAINLLPEDRDSLPEVVPVEWLNTGCTIYRRAALPSPAFDAFFHGYSLMEDLALSLRVGRSWRLANARTARIVHDSQPGDHKSDVRAMATMELVNRHYVMTAILERRRLLDFARLALWEAFQMASGLTHRHGRSQFFTRLGGQLDGIRQIRSGRT